MANMGLFSGLGSSDEPYVVTIGKRRLECMFCQGGQFWYREVKMNTTGMEFLDWAGRTNRPTA